MLTPMAAFARVADVVSDHRLIDDALQAADHVRQHRGPGELPHRPRQGAVHDAPIEALLRSPTVAHEMPANGGKRSFTAGSRSVM